MKGRRCFIGGSSPFVLDLDREVLKTGCVIGVNSFVTLWPCDYMVGVDSWNLLGPSISWCHKAKADGAKLIFANKGKAPDSKLEMVDYWFNESDKFVRRFDGRLVFKDSSATSALNMALLGGASEVILYGVDYVGVQRFDGVYSWVWHECVQNFNDILCEVQKKIPVYKLNSESKINAIYKSIEELY